MTCRYIAPAALAIALSPLSASIAEEREAPVFSAMPRAEFVAEYEQFVMSVWETAALLYTRLDPALIDTVPGRTWTHEDRELAGCTYDALEEEGALDALDLFARQGLDSSALIEADETLTVLTIIDRPEAIPGMNPPDDMMTAMIGCGSMALMSRRMKELGTMDALAPYFEQRNADD